MIHNYCVDSKEWYEGEEQAQAYLDLFATSYSDGIVAGEDALLEEIVGSLIEKYLSNLTYIDLGPGNGVKTDFMTSKLHSEIGIDHYKCVDIQPMYLDIAEKLVRDMGVPTSRFVGSFEHYLQGYKSSGNSFVYLGATFCNLDTSFDTRLSQACSSKDLIYLSSERFPKDIALTIKGYENAHGFLSPLAIKYSLDPETFHVKFNEELHQVEVGFKKADTFHVFLISKKPTEDEFRKRVNENFEGTFYMNDAHLGFVGSPKK
jgi:hypothetical protein